MMIQPGTVAKHAHSLALQEEGRGGNDGYPVNGSYILIDGVNTMVRQVAH